MFNDDNCISDPHIILSRWPRHLEIADTSVICSQHYSEMITETWQLSELTINIPYLEVTLFFMVEEKDVINFP